MEKLDIVYRIAELIIAIVGSAVITRIVTIRQRVRQEKAGADKAEEEAKSDQIDNIEKLVEKVYQPTIERLTEKVERLQERVDELERENDQLRAALREVNPGSVPSRRGVNGKSAQRNPDGTFAKQKEEAPADGE